MYALPPLVPATVGHASSSLPTPRSTRGGSATETMYALGAERTDEDRPQGEVLLPTPTTEPMTGNGHARNLGAEAKLLRTPTASVTEPKPGIKLDGRSRQDPQVGLIDQVLALLPTPAAGNFNDGESLESWERRKAEQAARGINGNGMGTPLAVAVKMLPTPSAADGMGGHERRGGERGSELLLAGLVKGKGRNQRNDESCLPGAVDRLLPTPTTGYTGTTAEEWRDRRPAGNGQRRGALGDLGLAVGSIGESTDPLSPATKPPSADEHPTLWTERDD